MSRMIIFRNLTLMLLLPALCAAALEPGAPSHKDSAATHTATSMKGVFPIGVWYDGRVEDLNCSAGFVDVPRDLGQARAYYEKTFTDIKRHGLEIVAIPNTPPAYRETLLGAADRAGVRIVLEMAELAWPEQGGGALCVQSPNLLKDDAELYRRLKAIIEPISRHPSVFAYQLIDEPVAALVPNMQRVARQLARIDPRRPGFSCMCNQGELARTAQTGLPMLVFDRYPIQEKMKPGNFDLRTGWIDTMDELNRQSRANDIPYWIVLQTFSKPNAYRYPTPAELSAMLWLALAHNAKGVFFFLYNSNTQEERMQGLVDTQLKPAPLFAVVARMAADLKKLAPLLLQLQPAPSIIAVNGAAAIDVQTFAGPHAARYVFVTNMDVVKPAELRATVTQPGALSLTNMLTKKKIVLDQSTGSPFLKLSLAPGEGQLLRVRCGQ